MEPPDRGFQVAGHERKTVQVYKPHTFARSRINK